MLVNELGKFVSHTDYGTLPKEVTQAVKIRILDLLTAQLVGYQLGNHKVILAILHGSGDTSVWGSGTGLALRDAILVNSFLAHSTYLEDGSRYTGGHPSSVVIPSAIALAETERLSGRDLIASVAVGYEVFLRLGRLIYPSTVVRGFQSTAVLGAVASAAACSSLLRLPAPAAKNALAIACSLGVGLKEALKCSASQPLQVGRSCEGGLLAAMFARQGAEGADSIIEGGFMRAFADNAEASQVASELGKSFRIFETYLKVHGGCRGSHAPVDVVQNLVRRHAIKPDDIEQISLHVDSVTYAADMHEPRNGTQSQFSVSFSVAALLCEGNASIFQFTDEKISDLRIRSMMARVKVAVDTNLDKSYPDKRGAVAEIVLADGRCFAGSIDNARGEPEYPFTTAEIENKFLSLTRDVLGANAERVRDLVMELEKISDVRFLVEHLKHGDSSVPI